MPISQYFLVRVLTTTYQHILKDPSSNQLTSNSWLECFWEPERAGGNFFAFSLLHSQSKIKSSGFPGRNWSTCLTFQFLRLPTEEQVLKLSTSGSQQSLAFMSLTRLQKTKRQFLCGCVSTFCTYRSMFHRDMQHFSPNSSRTHFILKPTWNILHDQSCIMPQNNSQKI